MSEKIKKGNQLALDIETLAFGGRGVVRVDGLVIFVEDALPGQTVQARITRKRKGFAEAKCLRVEKKSPEEVAPKCAHFGECGGCRFQNLDYQAQLKYKQQQVVESLEHIGGIKNPPVQPALASPEPYYYRNKMEFSFGTQRWVTQNEIDREELTKPKNFALGLHVRGRFDKILDLDECYLQSPRTIEILSFVRKFVLNMRMPVYSTRDHAGFWRYLVMRESKNTHDCMVNLVTADVADYFDDVKKLAEQLVATFPEITTVVHNINRKKAQVAFGDEEIVLFGPGYIQEKIHDRVFQISANSFFQTNTRGAEWLFDKALEFADLKMKETVYDLYSGAGTISLCAAESVKKVLGFELVESAVKDAELNCQLNGVANCTFVSGDLKETLNFDEIIQSEKPATVFIDPPRAGMHADVLKAVLRLQPEKIVYISCNPTTFARDARAFCESDYQLRQVQPMDMFPMTTHIELVSLLERI
ncbi:MAG: 23S rRNA (uracil(1939)-C(5))-methyltransferase RlmD [bacterium]